MISRTFSAARFIGTLCTIAMTIALAGCASSSSQSTKTAQADASKPENAAAVPPAAVAPTAVAPTAAPLPTIRIKAGVDEALKDSKGNTWAADTGFDGGEGVDRPDLQITGTDRPELYHSEHYSMDAYTIKVPNGNYDVKLHFSEDYDGITDASMRVFTYAVKDGDATTGKTIKEVKDFSPWKAAGAQYKAYVDTVPVTVTAGQISIKFTAQVENPQINAIEIVPR